MGSSAGKIIGQIAPIVASFIPGIGLPLAAAIGGASGLLQGGGLKGGLLGAAGGALGAGGLGADIGGSLLGEGASSIGSRAIGGALGGALNGAGAGGGLGGALGGAALGGLASGGSAYLGQNGGLSGLLGGDGSTVGGGQLDSVANGNFDDIGQGGFGGAGMSAGENALVNKATAGLSAAGGGGSSFGGSGSGTGGGTNLANLLSGVGNVYNQNKATDELVKSQQQSLDAMQPFLQNGTNASNALGDYLGTSGNTGAANYGAGTTPFTAADLENEPGYQFNLAQGNKALNNSLAASGSLDSGAAIKAGQTFAQGLADTTYGNAYNRDLQNKQLTGSLLSGAAAPGLAAAGGTADINSNIGTALSKGTQATGNTITSTLASLLGGAGAKSIVGYKPDGTPIYA